MRQSYLLQQTLREVPADAEAVSHQLLIRAGFMRQLAAGIYTLLPLGHRVLHKLQAMIRREMDAVDAQETLMPIMQPAELWQQSGRYDVYGPELMRVHDRHDRSFALGPTHEEVITALVRDEVRSYRKLPIVVYQIQTKFRDERRPRFGLIRGREFMMKDAYSFDRDEEGLKLTYQRMFAAYHRIFAQCSLEVRAIEADAGQIGGEGGSHEFSAIANVGEDIIVVCSHCQYAANIEAARSIPSPFTASAWVKVEGSEKLEKFATPHLHSVADLTQAFPIQPGDILKTMIYIADGQPYAVVVRGDDEVHELKVMHALEAEDIREATEEEVRLHAGVPIGSIGPIGLSVPVLIDKAIAAMDYVVVGANEMGYHYRNVSPAKAFDFSRVGDYRMAKEQDRCPCCDEGRLIFQRGIEIGQVFQLGTHYSEKLGAAYLDEQGKSRPMVMGCYGIGVSRLMAAIVEQHHDEHGMNWPMSVAPFQVHLIVIAMKDSAQVALAEELYHLLQIAGIEVLLDDRTERAGVKFNDADLMGIPLRVVVGREATEGIVEFSERHAPKSTTAVHANEILALIQQKYSQP